VTSASASHAPLLRALKCTVLYTRWYVVAHSEAVHARPAVMGTHVNRAKLAGRAAAMPSSHADDYVCTYGMGPREVSRAVAIRWVLRTVSWPGFMSRLPVFKGGVHAGVQTGAATCTPALPT
jgi:hypothetical protein